MSAPQGAVSHAVHPVGGLNGDRHNQLSVAELPQPADAAVVPLAVPALGEAAGDFHRWSVRYLRSLLGLDALAGATAVLVAAALPLSARPDSVIDWVLLGVIGAVLWPLWVAWSRGYSRRHLGLGRTESGPVLRAAGITIVLAALLTVLFGLDGLLGLAVMGAPAAAVGSIAIRYGRRHRLQRSRHRGAHLRRVIMVGRPEGVRDLCRAVERDPGLDMRVAGVCVPESEMDRARAMGLPVLGNLDQVADAARTSGSHAVAVSGNDAGRQSFLRQLAWSLEDADVDLLVHPGVTDVAAPRMHLRPHAALPLLQIEQPRFDRRRRVIKRATDLVLTGLGMPLIAPVLLAVAVAIKIDDRHAPVIFRQSRIGIGGKPFTMYKFRTMSTDAEARLAELREQNEGAGPLFKIENDPRVTRVGHLLRRYSLDELPQLFNVLQGSMSLVGPRPPLQSEVDGYTDQVRRKFKVIPGVTGMWQVSGRSLLSWEESVRLDLSYVENWSLGLDLQILSRTAYAVLARRGAY